MKKIAIGLVAAILGLALVACFISPFVAAQRLIRAARTGDVAGLEQTVDFPALRASLKSELNARAAMEIRDRTGENRALAALGMMLAPSLVEGAVDGLVTPEGVAAMVRSGDKPRPEKPVPSADTPATPKERIHQSWAYRGVNRFAVTLTRDDRPDDPLVLIMERRGPLSWKLAGVDLTPDPMG